MLRFCFISLQISFCLSTYLNRLLGDESHQELLEATEKNIIIKFRENRHLYDLQKKYTFYVEDVVDLVSGEKKKTLVVFLGDSRVVFPPQSAMNGIISHFYESYKGEGARKLCKRISDSYAGISKRNIQDYILPAKRGIAYLNEFSFDFQTFLFF